METRQLLHQIQDILPAAAIIVVLGAAAFGIGYFLMRARTSVVRMGNSYEARGLRTLERFSEGNHPGEMMMETGVVEAIGQLLPDPTGQGDSVVYYRHVVNHKIQKSTEDRRIGGGDMNFRSSKVLEDQGGVDFNLKADDGRVYRVQSKDLVSAMPGGNATMVAKSGYGKEAPAYLLAIAEKKGLSLTQFGMKKELTAFSWLLRPGDRVTVVGPYSRGADMVTIGKQGEFPVVLLTGDLKQAIGELELNLD